MVSDTATATENMKHAGFPRAMSTPASTVLTGPIRPALTLCVTSRFRVVAYGLVTQHEIGLCTDLGSKRLRPCGKCERRAVQGSQLPASSKRDVEHEPAGRCPWGMPHDSNTCRYGTWAGSIYVQLNSTSSGSPLPPTILPSHICLGRARIEEFGYLIDTQCSLTPVSNQGREPKIKIAAA